MNRVTEVNLITSSGLSRVYRLMQDSCVGFISAFREYRSLEENNALNDILETYIRQKDFGFVPVKGDWKEKGEPLQVDHTFAISRPSLSKEELIANLVELGRMYPEFNQRSYMAVCDGIAYFIAGPDSSAPEGSITGSAEKFEIVTFEKWQKLLQDPSFEGGRSTLVRGPKNRSFTFSCGSFYDGFTKEPTFVKPGILSNLRKAVYRVNSSLDPDSDDYDSNEDPSYQRILQEQLDRNTLISKAREWALANWPVGKNNIREQFPDYDWNDLELTDILKDCRYQKSMEAANSSITHHSTSSEVSEADYRDSLEQDKIDNLVKEVLFCSKGHFRGVCFGDLPSNSLREIILSSREGMEVVKGSIGKRDIVFISAFISGSDKESNKVLDSRLTKELSSYGFGWYRFLGHFEFVDKDSGEIKGGDEWSFGVINNGISTDKFFNLFVNLGNKYKQFSILLVPSRDITFNGTSLEGAVAYNYNLALSGKEGQVDYLGQVTDASISNWLQKKMQGLADNGYAGWTRSTGFGEVRKDANGRSVGAGAEGDAILDFASNSYKFVSVDFSNVYAGAIGMPAKDIMSRRYALENSYNSPINSSINRRPTIKQRYLSSNWEEKYTSKQAAMGMLSLGMNPSEIDQVIKHWDSIQSSTGPRTLAEWKLYERSKKLREGGFSYRDAVGILARDAGTSSKRVKDIIGTSEEWRLGYYDDGLQPLDPAIEEEQKRQVKIIKEGEKKQQEVQKRIESRKAGLTISLFDLLIEFKNYSLQFSHDIFGLLCGQILVSSTRDVAGEAIKEFVEKRSHAFSSYLQLKSKLESISDEVLDVDNANRIILQINSIYKDIDDQVKVINSFIQEVNQELSQIKYECDDLNQMLQSAPRNIDQAPELLIPPQARTSNK